MIVREQFLKQTYPKNQPLDLSCHWLVWRFTPESRHPRFKQSLFTAMLPLLIADHSLDCFTYQQQPILQRNFPSEPQLLQKLQRKQVRKTSASSGCSRWWSNLLEPKSCVAWTSHVAKAGILGWMWHEAISTTSPPHRASKTSPKPWHSNLIYFLIRNWVFPGRFFPAKGTYYLVGLAWLLPECASQIVGNCQVRLAAKWVAKSSEVTERLERDVSLEVFTSICLFGWLEKVPTKYSYQMINAWNA